MTHIAIYKKNKNRDKTTVLSQNNRQETTAGVLPADGELMINSYFDILQTEVPVSKDAGTFVFPGTLIYE